jgi:hypothetical protein
MNIRRCKVDSHPNRLAAPYHVAGANSSLEMRVFPGATELLLAYRIPRIYYWECFGDGSMGNSQKRAIQNYRSRLSARGLSRFEVLGRDADRDLIRTLARRLAEDSAEASRLRAAVQETIAGEPPKKGGILAALRRSPLVGADLELTRSRDEDRKVDL